MPSNLENNYSKTESDFSVRDRHEYSSLVRANGNSSIPVQRWFHFKEAFSVDLLSKLLQDWSIPISGQFGILDPFCGVGTSLLSAQKLALENKSAEIEVFGVERNPFIHFVAETKANWRSFNLDIFEAEAEKLLDLKVFPKITYRPSLSTLKNDKVISPYTLNKALSYRQSITKIKARERDLLLLGFASILEGISGFRKDGRALRIVAKKKRSQIREALRIVWEEIARDLAIAEKTFSPVVSKVYLGDGRSLSSLGFSANQFNVIYYSPPYLNNIDYSEVYKVEAWLSGFIQNEEAFRNLRLSTFRSHPSVSFPNPIGIATSKNLANVRIILDSLVSSFPVDKNLRRRQDLVYGYFDDMYISLKQQLRYLKPGGWIFCVVGNSLHGPNDDQTKRVVIASDIIIAEIARALGLDIVSIDVARNLRRRPPHSKFLRESIVVLKKRE